jgi:hypothetical protein
MVGGAPLSASVSSSARAIKVVVGAALLEKSASGSRFISSVRAAIAAARARADRAPPSRSADAIML